MIKVSTVMPIQLKMPSEYVEKIDNYDIRFFLDDKDDEKFISIINKYIENGKIFDVFDIDINRLETYEDNIIKCNFLYNISVFTKIEDIADSYEDLNGHTHYDYIYSYASIKIPTKDKQNLLDELTAFFRDAFNNNKIQILSINLEVTDDDLKD